MRVRAHPLLLLAVARWLDDHGVLDRGLGTLFVEGNSALALFNLLPVLPLDGGRILRGMLARGVVPVREPAAARRLGPRAPLAFLLDRAGP